MTQEQIWAALLVASVAVVVQVIKAAGEVIRARSKKIAATIEGEASGVQSRTETERMGILYMQQLVKENEKLRQESKSIAETIATLSERVRSREEQLAIQSELKVDAMKQVSVLEKKVSTAEAALVNVQLSAQNCTSKLAESHSQVAELLGKYNELHQDVEERRKDWHDDRNTWAVLDSARQTEVQRARFIARQLNARLTQDQLDIIRQATSAKGFDYDQFVEVAGSLEMSEIEDLRRENETLKSQLASFSAPLDTSPLSQSSSQP